MNFDPRYYQPDLAWIHHTGYSRHVEQTGPGILRLLRDAGLASGALVLDVGCGSGLLARELLAAGYTVHGVDASSAMIELARRHAPAASFHVARLPTRLPTGTPGGLPLVDAVVSTGHVLNYLDSEDEIGLALAEMANAARPGGTLAIDLMTLAFAAAHDAAGIHAKVTDDWVIVTRFSRPAPDRFDRSITTFRRYGEHWRRSDEYHRNLLIAADGALRVLRDHGVAAQVRTAFGDEVLPDGLVVLSGVRR